MAKQTKKSSGKAQTRKTVCIAAAIAAVLLIAVAVILVTALNRSGPEVDGGGLLEELSGLSGYSRTVSQTEYDFFYNLVERDLYAAEGEEDVDQITQDYVNEVNAKFYLGSCLGLCEPFDFAVMQFRMEQENAIRKAEKENGGTIYGVTQFTLTSYFNYLDSNLETEIVNYLIDHADQPMLDWAEEYYNANLTSFTYLASLTYTLERDGKTATETLDSAGLRTLQNMDETLGGFLASAQPGDALDYEDAGGLPCRAVLVDAVYETPAFADARAAALRIWLNAEVMDGLYASIAQNVPVTFALNT